ncbi:MAG: hypothetical protein EOS79_11460 [Mesorhizobium sp.]|nr:MAG: hypothetical protein EOS79_11460 [Mesorhizobium sp.]
MSNIVYVRSYQRRKPERSPQFRALHNRLVDEVEFMEISDDIALALAADFEAREAGYVKDQN